MKHAKSKNTSNQMKKIRDYQSSLVNLPSNKSTQRNDESSLLKYNTKSKNIEYKNQPKKPFAQADINICQNIGEPIRHAGLERKGRVSSKGRLSRKFYDSQVVLGDDQNYMPMSTTKFNYTNLVRVHMVMQYRG